MNAAGKALEGAGVGRLKRRALSLGAVKVFDQAMNFLLPVVLVRCLDSATFGEYRLLWLMVGTIVAVAPLNMGGSLYFHLPRAQPGRRKVLVHNTVLYFAGAGLAFGLLVGPWNPLLPSTLAPLAKYGALVPAFVALWLASVLLNYLPTVEERIGWQVRATLATSALRAVLVAGGAWWSGDLATVLWLLLVVVAAKLALLLYYLHRHHGLGRPWFGGAEFVGQLRYSAPFGVANALFALRSQADQWVAASLFALSSFAAFAVAALVGQVVHIFRHAVMEAFLPTMSRLEAGGDVRAMLALNARGNLIVGTLIYPLLAFAFAFAEDLVTLVYTQVYLEAAPVMRVYIVGMAAMVIEIGSMMLLLQQGRFALKVTACTLLLAVATSLTGAHWFGLPGAAVGSVLGIYLDRVLLLSRVVRHTGVPLARLQHWRSLAWVAASAVLAAALAWTVVAHVLEDRGTLARLATGAALLGLAYGAANWRKLRSL